MDEDERAIRQLVDDWMAASRAGDDARVLELMDEDAVFLVAGRPAMRGRAAFAGAQMGMPKFRIEGRAEVREVRVFGDWAYGLSHLTVAMTPLEGGPTSRRAGPALSVFRKLQGRWLLYRDANLLAPAEA